MAAVVVAERKFCDAVVDTSDLDFLEPLISSSPVPWTTKPSFMERFGRRRSCQLFLVACIVFSSSLVFFIFMYCSDVRPGTAGLCLMGGGLGPSSSSSAALSRRLTGSNRRYSWRKNSFTEDDYYLGGNFPVGHESRTDSERLGYRDIMEDDFEFDITKNDVMVFLHIQKTGGTTFGKHLVEDLMLEKPCMCHRMKFKKKKKKKKRCDCYRPNGDKIWLFSRYSTGWRCGLHADWTELNDCVDRYLDDVEGPAKRRYFYVTLLRDPVNRYLSEFAHVRRGATWRNSVHACGGRPATKDELPKCYAGDDWSGVELEEFLNCSFNLAANRQARMLADLELVGCYNRSYMPEAERNRVILASAKKNLDGMAYFGLTEYQKLSQYIFEETFNFQFSVGFEQYGNVSTHSGEARKSLPLEMLERVKDANALDIELYSFAKAKFLERYEWLKSQDSEFEDHFGLLGGRAWNP